MSANNKFCNYNWLCGTKRALKCTFKDALVCKIQHINISLEDIIDLARRNVIKSYDDGGTVITQCPTLFFFKCNRLLMVVYYCISLLHWLHFGYIFVYISLI